MAYWKKLQPSRGEARASVLAVKLGVPLPYLLETLREIIGGDCAYCKLYNQVLRKLNRLGEPQVIRLLSQILDAKDAQDESRLAQLRKEFNDGNR